MLKEILHFLFFSLKMFYNHNLFYFHLEAGKLFCSGLCGKIVFLKLNKLKNNNNKLSDLKTYGSLLKQFIKHN